MLIVSPKANTAFTIDSDTVLPMIDVQTDAPGSHVWDWSIVWGTYSRKGQLKSTDGCVSFQPALTDLGGVLTIRATAGKASATTKIKIIGTNPAAHQVQAYLATKANSAGFGAIIEHETHYKHFTAAGEPKKSFDNGYGICQLTTPAPTFEQCWNWKRNIDAGLALFAQKVRAATTYLSQQGRTYTPDQLQREAVSRWNGGAYHTWDGKAWVRNPDILCDTRTGNMGWDMTNPDNAGQTEAQLHKRDQADYRGGRTKGDPWIYSGVCYADALLG